MNAVVESKKVPPRCANTRGRGNRYWRYPMHAESSTRTIPLTRGRVALVDECDHEMLSFWNWSFMKVGYAQAWVGSSMYDRRKSTMHRVIMLPDPSQQVDHINGDRLDNRRCNLRLCSGRENQMNRKKSSGKSSSYKGVSFFPRTGRWASRIKVHGRNLHLGYFVSEKDAALAYDAAALHHFGEFARLNFSDEVSR